MKQVDKRGRSEQNTLHNEKLNQILNVIWKFESGESIIRNYAVIRRKFLTLSFILVIYKVSFIWINVV